MHVRFLSCLMLNLEFLIATLWHLKKFGEEFVIGSLDQWLRLLELHLIYLLHFLFMSGHVSVSYFLFFQNSFNAHHLSFDLFEVDIGLFLCSFDLIFGFIVCTVKKYVYLALYGL
jgi:hypothetical protein